MSDVSNAASNLLRLASFNTCIVCRRIGEITTFVLLLSTSESMELHPIPILYQYGLSLLISFIILIPIKLFSSYSPILFNLLSNSKALTRYYHVFPRRKHFIQKPVLVKYSNIKSVLTSQSVLCFRTFFV